MVGQSQNNLNSFSCPKIIMISSIQHLPLIQSKSFLLQKYIKEGLPPAEIAHLTFSCRSTVIKYLHLHEIPLRHEDRSCTAGRVFGQRRVKGKVKENKKELETIEKMIALRQQGNSYGKIADILNTMKVRTRTNKGVWYPKTVRQVLLRALL